jgi:carbonic anhydrase
VETTPQQDVQAARRAAMPARRTAILTCMDARIDPLALVDMELGDAHVLRNAGGRVTDDVLRSLAIATQLLGIRRIVVVHHTGCGLAGATNDGLRAEIGALTEADVTIDFRPIADFGDALAEDVQALAASPLLPADLTVEAGVLDIVGDGGVTWHRVAALPNS